MEKKGEVWKKNADTVQQYQAAATAGLVCVSMGARNRDMQTQPKNTKGWNTQAAKCYREHMAALVSLLL